MNVITQYYTKEHKDLFDLTNKINQKYADKNGFKYVSNNKKRCIGEKALQHPGWEKIAWLLELLPTLDDNTLVVYADCDSLFLKGDLNAALHDGYDIGMVQLRGGLGGKEVISWFNSGVIVLINTPVVRDFLQRVWVRTDINEEISIKKELKAQNNTIGRSKKMCSLDIEWNSWNNNDHISNDANIKSFHGLSYDNKLKNIKEFLTSIK